MEKMMGVIWRRNLKDEIRDNVENDGIIII